MTVKEFLEVIRDDDECCIHIKEQSSDWAFTVEGEAYNLQKMLKPVFLTATVENIKEAFHPNGTPVHCISAEVIEV